MNTKIDNINDTRKKITITFDSAQTEQEKQKTISQFVRYAKVDGFREGKAPLDLVLKKYADKIDESFKRSLVESALESLNSIKEFEIYSVVKVDQTIDKDGATIDLTADIYPDIKLPTDLKTTVEVESTEVKDEEVEKVVDYYRNQRAQYEPVEREIKKGDFVNLSYEGKIGKTLISELAPDATMYGSQKSTWEEAGNEDAPGVKAIVKALVGMKKGDKVQVKEKFDDKIAYEALQNKEATYDIEVLEVREKILPEFNDEFCKNFKAESAQDLREKIKTDIKSEKENYSEVLKREKAVEQLMSGIEFPLPESAIEDEREMILSEMMMRYMSQGITNEMLESNKEALFEGASKDALPRAKMRIFLMKLARANKLSVTNEDMSRIVWQEAMRARVKPDDFVKGLKGDQQKINRLRSDALLQKAINFVAEKAEVKIKA